MAGHGTAKGHPVSKTGAAATSHGRSRLSHAPHNQRAGEEVPRKRRSSEEAREPWSWGCGTKMHVVRLIAPVDRRRAITPRTETSRPADIRARGKQAMPTRCA